MVLKADTTCADLTILSLDSIADHLERALCYCLGSMTTSMQSDRVMRNTYRVSSAEANNTI